MKYLLYLRFLSLSVFALVLFCSSPETKNYPVQGDLDFEGWGGPPEEPQKKPFNYVYFQVSGRASKAAINTKQRARIKASCLNAIDSNKKEKFVRILRLEAMEEVFTSYRELDRVHPVPKTFYQWISPYTQNITVIKCKHGPSSELLIAESECICNVCGQIPPLSEVIKRLELQEQ